jgi:hypothetical protein
VKALDVLVNGLHVLGRNWSDATEVLRGWPSMYELLPTNEVIWHESAGKGTVPSELSLPNLDHSLVDVARGSHRAIADGWAPQDGVASGVRVVPFVGVGQRTLQRARWDGATLAVEAWTPSWLSSDATSGDSTVSEDAAVPAELVAEPDRVRPVLCRHSSFVDLDDVGQLVRWLSIKGPYRGAMPRESNLVGLEVDALIAVGPLHEMAVMLSDGDGQPAPRDARPRARYRLAGPTRAWRTLACVPGDSAWVAGLPSLPAGTYEVEVSAPGWLASDVAPVRELVAVVDPDAAHLDNEEEEFDANEEGGQ